MLVDVAGVKFRVHTDAPGHLEFWQKMNSGEWESGTLSVLREHLTRNTKFLDIGAWIGPTGLTAAAIGARVVVFEPDPVAYKHLLANIALNPELAGQIEVHNAAAWISDGQRRLGSGRFGFGDSMSSFATESENGVIVQTVDVAKLHGDFVKIDVEGAEYDIIPRAASTLLKNRPPLLLATHGVSGGARNRMTQSCRMAKLLWSIRGYRRKFLLRPSVRPFRSADIPRALFGLGERDMFFTNSV